MSQTARQRYQADKAAGLCVTCRRRPARTGYVTCCECAMREARRKHHDAAYVMREYPSITFECSKCGRQVTTDGIKDHRTRFCSQECEKRYWRHPPYERDMRHRK